ncbi:hypothetical protein [Rhodoligotrophos defluvii]|uniref:hypothetical protein n=1 Tax=Rhodoligotrophos defluvii TaxID=2561934 RepID=UPI0010C99690|nr:hypothetical protein [Rhodoligotrophos defluvii]
MQWIAEHRELIAALTGMGTLLIWLIYLQVFISNYRRQLRATLLIMRGAGDGVEARCFICNMSSGPVYVQSVIVTLETPDEAIVHPVTDMLDLEGDAPADPRLRTRQGPLAGGELRDIGSFGNLVRHVLRGNGHGSDHEGLQTAIRSVVIEALGIYGSEDLPIGARRRFVLLEKDGAMRIHGEGLQTQQIRTRRERRRLLADLERDR